MHIWLDTQVITSDGATVGRVSRLLVHPASWKLLAIAVRQGPFLRREELALPPEVVNHASPAGVWLNIEPASFKSLERVRAAGWQRPPPAWVTPLGWPPGRVFWPAGYDGAVYPEITTGQLRGWGTLRAASWCAPRPFPRPADDQLPEFAGDRVEVELEREWCGESLLDVDPYDVLARISESGFKTTYELDDASMINPQPRPSA